MIQKKTKRFFKCFSLFLSVFTLQFLCACVNVSYIGDSYPPTSSVRFFFDEKDIPEDYFMIGKVTATLSEDDAAFLSDNAINEEIRKKALSVGADAILILSSTREHSGTYSTGNSDTFYSERKKGKYYDDTDIYSVGNRRYHGTAIRNDGKYREDTKGYVSTSESSSTRELSTYVVHAMFLKRK